MGRYVTTGQIMEILPVFISTAGLTPGQLEFFIETREDEIDARLGRNWDMSVFSGSGNAPPMIRTLAKLGASIDVRKSKISMEDPSVSQWIVEDEKKFENLITSLGSGTADLVNNAGAIIGRRTQTRDMVWSSTKAYQPTMNILDPTEQRKSPSRDLDKKEEMLGDITGQ